MAVGGDFARRRRSRECTVKATSILLVFRCVACTALVALMIWLPWSESNISATSRGRATQPPDAFRQSPGVLLPLPRGTRGVPRSRRWACRWPAASPKRSRRWYGRTPPSTRRSSRTRTSAWRPEAAPPLRASAAHMAQGPGSTDSRRAWGWAAHRRPSLSLERTRWVVCLRAEPLSARPFSSCTRGTGHSPQAAGGRLPLQSRPPLPTQAEDQFCAGVAAETAARNPNS